MKKGLIKGMMATLGGVLLCGMMSVSALAATGDVPINALTFPDGNFRQYVLNNIDTTSPKGVLSQAEMQKVTQMDLAARGMKNLKGIEYFTALQELDCRRNSLTELNVKKNTSLQILDCGANQLQELYLTNNTALQELYATGNRIACLDLSKNTALTTIYIPESRLEVLKLGKCAKLTLVDVSANRLKELDVTGCPNLSNLNVSLNKIHTLDVSQNMRLWNLNCKLNKIGYINLDNNKVLRSSDFSQNEYWVLAEINSDGDYVIDLTKIGDGFDPEKLLSVSEGTRIGDILIVPSEVSSFVIGYEPCFFTSKEFRWYICTKKVVTIINQPTSKVVRAGDQATFEVYAEGERLNYQWYYSMDGGITWKKSTALCAQTSTFTITADPKWNGMLLKCTVTGEYGRGSKVTSKAVKLYVPGTPAITKQPSNVITVVGNKASFTVAAEGSGLTYQWAYSTDQGVSWHTSTASSATTATFSITAATKWDGAMFRCYITDSKGNKNTSKDAILVVKETPVITTQPVSATAAVGVKATFKVAAKGDGLTYNWLYSTDNGKNWQPSTASCAKTATFSITAAAKWNGMKLKCQIKDKDGVVITSNVATLTVK